MEDHRNDSWRDTTVDGVEVAAHPETAEAVQAIERLRGSIDNVDTAIVMLLAERFKYTEEVGRWKAQAGFAPADAEREHRQVARLRTLAEQAGLDPDIAEGYHAFVVGESKTRHQRIADAS